MTNSPLVETITFKRNGTAVMTTSKTHDYVNRLAQTISVAGAATVSGHAYTHNSLNQRTHAEEADGNYWAYQYNSKGEVVNGTKHDAADNPLTGLNLGYAFDGIGNRLTTSVDTVTDATYSANKLNQYTTVAAAGTVNPVHDADGNMVLAWDGEPRRLAGAEMDGQRQPVGRDEREARASQNRLKTVHRKSDSALIATYTYDDQSRRVRKQTTMDAPQRAEDRAFLWDGWNKVAEMSHNAGTFTAVRYHTWGLDLSGNEQGAGGVGGLVMQEEAATSEVYFTSYDGNGNVASMVKASDGSVAASYEYDPFGKLTGPSGAYAAINPYRFSTKPWDEETEWYYYGFRYYNPTTGRWLNRDPIGEDGGLNFYEMTGNDALNMVDVLGRIPAPTSWLPNLTGIAGAKGWNHLAALFSKWFSSPAHVIPDGRIVNPSDPYDDTTITENWVVGFSRAQVARDKMLRKNNWVNNADVKFRLRERIGPLLTSKHTFLGEKWLNGQTSWADLNKVWIKQETVTSGISLNMDALDAALHAFNWMAVVKGCGIKLPSGKMSMTIEEIGYYVRDTFNFQGNQDLGYWALPNIVFPPYMGEAMSGGLAYGVRDQSFRDYRATTGRGGDFFVFTKIQRVTLDKPYIIDF